MIRLKRAYETPTPGDGLRILVERLWPRGLTKTAAQIDIWYKELAPSTELRKWYGHQPERWEEFQRRYKQELHEQQALLTELQQLCHKEETVTFIFAAKDEAHNSAIVLKQILESRD
jgi:uncharacterized protein YeaO (DUF488 family)